ncbi:hypothetical protein PMZ80_004867 [Knufia obscura]|uniref:Uncharacterized protein n=1 Tax=Knufia obscura TaxID=1635080 RepID=A0ABR0RPZ5_9EURO|nr:hypothetical protein PMZ80_004867 [Knufia obscura]
MTTFTTIAPSILGASQPFNTAQPSSSTGLSPAITTSSASKMYTLDECVYYVNTSDSQKAVYGIMATSLVINFGVLIWWLRLYCYKRKQRKAEQEVPPEKELDGMSMSDLDVSRSPSLRPRLIDASRKGMRSTEDSYGGRAPPPRKDKEEPVVYRSYNPKPRKEAEDEIDSGRPRRPAKAEASASRSRIDKSPVRDRTKLGASTRGKGKEDSGE